MSNFIYCPQQSIFVKYDYNIGRVCDLHTKVGKDAIKLFVEVCLPHTKSYYILRDIYGVQNQYLVQKTGLFIMSTSKKS